MKFATVTKCHLRIILIYIIFSVLPIGEALAVTYYVSPIGLDSNSGTEANPFKTIQKAAGIVSAGDTVIVKDGTYTGEATIAALNRSGNPNNWITFKSQNKGGAIINGNNNSSSIGFLIMDNTAYIRIEGFDIRGINTVGVFLSWGTHDVAIVRNHFYNIGNVNTGSPYGMGAMFQRPTSYNLIVDRNEFNDIGRPHPNDNDWHDQVLYFEGDNVTITNNVFYNNTSGWCIVTTQVTGNESIDNWLISNNTFYVSDAKRSEFHYTDGFINLEDYNDSITVQNNIFYNPPVGGASVRNWVSTGTASRKTNILLSNNITYNGVTMTTPTPSGFTVMYNDSIDPQLINITTMPYDFRLKPISTAINKGNVTNAPSYDYLGLYRDTAPDIGAYEYNGTSQTYPCSDGIDNDGDGLIDYPNDPGCSSGTDNDEFNSSNSAPLPVNNSLSTLKTIIPITIDGNLSENAWSNANYVIFSNPSRSDNQVKVYTLWNDTNLYFAYEVSDGHLEALNTQLWTDDGVEIYLDTQNNKTATMDSNDYHFTININNLISGVNIIAQRTSKATGYTMEIAVPWSVINKLPSSGMTMGLLLGNNDRDNSQSSQFDWLNLIETGSYSRPNLWGNIVVSDSQVGSVDLTPPAPPMALMIQ